VPVGQASPSNVQTIVSSDKWEIFTWTKDCKSQISEKQIRAAVEIPRNFQASLEQSKPETVQIYFYEGEIKSSFGANRVEKFFKEYRESIVNNRLSARNIPGSVLSPFEVKQKNVAPPEKVSGAA